MSETLIRITREAFALPLPLVPETLTIHGAFVSLQLNPAGIVVTTHPHCASAPNGVAAKSDQLRWTFVEDVAAVLAGMPVRGDPDELADELAREGVALMELREKTGPVGMDEYYQTYHSASRVAALAFRLAFNTLRRREND